MEAWRRVWRAVPVCGPEGLAALYRALVSDDHRLLQGVTCTPPPLQCTQDWPVEMADPVVFGRWMEQLGEYTVAEAEEHFALWCFDVDQALGEPAVCRYFLNWWDNSPRDEVFRLLAKEVLHSLTGAPIGMPLSVIADWLADRGDNERELLTRSLM